MSARPPTTPPAPEPPGYEPCRLCPRLCDAQREAGATGFCGQGDRLRLALASLHFGEEPPLVGNRGSGTIFFSGCTLRCAFCQNFQISQQGLGREVGTEEFAAICLALQAAGAANINLVTGTQFIPGIVAGIAAARAAGLALPVLWNGSGYERVEMVAALRGTVDVWLPDLKTLNRETARRYFAAPDYPEVATAAILAMAEAHPLEYDEAGLLRRGLILRHLVLPGQLADSRAVLTWFSRHLAGRALPSIMTQYTPIAALAGRPAPKDALGQAEYEELVALIDELGLGEGFYQELVPGSDWLPDFCRPNPFSSDLARTIWHHAGGFAAKQG
ncbi:MAG TPA: radical SAM protein [Opitutaceae bacterium]|nr:radical SAM protein [Opitutaceae bacterium]